MANKDLQDHIAGAVYGLAYGDAWGWPNEFEDNRAVLETYATPFPNPAIITDDTQMSLYVIEAMLRDLYGSDSDIRRLIGAGYEPSIDEIRVKVADALLVWLDDPRNDRTPGLTCIGSLRNLKRLGYKRIVTGLEGTNDNSKGNGANMRAPWLGLLHPTVPEEWIAILGAIQASVTHNHPLALAAAALTAVVTKALATGEIVPGEGRLVAFLYDKTWALINAPYAERLPEQYLTGLYELCNYLDSQQPEVDKFLAATTELDVSVYFGPGAVAEQALLMAAALLDKYQDDAIGGLRRVAHITGDADTVGAIAGAFFGAAYDINVFPREWQTRLEPQYAAELAGVVDGLVLLGNMV